MQLIDNIILGCGSRFGAEDLQFIRDVVASAVKDYDIAPKETALALHEDATDRMIRMFAVELKVQQRSNKTIKQYVWGTRKFFDAIGKPYTDVTADDVVYYFARLTRSKEMSTTSIDNMRRFVHPFFKWLTDNDYIARDPFRKIKPFKRADKRKEILTQDEIVKLQDACKDSPLDLAIVDFLTSTGVRVSELRNLDRDNVDLIKGEVQVYATKTGKWRTVFLSSAARKHLFDYMSTRTDIENALFVGQHGDRMSTQCIERHLRNAGKKAEIDKKITVHVFRKTCASILHSKGMGDIDIATLLGHASISTTVKYYIKTDMQDLQQHFRKCIA